MRCWRNGGNRMGGLLSQLLKCLRWCFRFLIINQSGALFLLLVVSFLSIVYLGRRVDTLVAQSFLGPKPRATPQLPAENLDWSGRNLRTPKIGVGKLSAVADLIRRILPAHVDSFSLSLEPRGVDDSEWYSIQQAPFSDGGRVELRGSSGISLAVAFNEYLKGCAHWTVGWDGDRQIPPSAGDGAVPLPRCNANYTHGKRSAEYTYYGNVCTDSYTRAFWGWEEWERHLDWLALNGVNLPLAWAGQEFVWARTFERFGVLEEELRAHYFAGPAYLAWHRMGNIRGLGGPLPRGWLVARRDLQRRILKRMRGLGMEPVLPMFVGHVPHALVKRFPDANFQRSERWGLFEERYTRVWRLAFDDPLFSKIGRAFLEEQARVYGRTLFYSGDQFNEMQAPSRKPAVLSAASAAVWGVLKEAEPSAVWVLQGWLFVASRQFWGRSQIESYLGAVPHGHLLVLDLFSEVAPVWSRTGGDFFGQAPFVWSMLYSFGGNLGMGGSLARVVAGAADARRISHGAMVGVGVTAEALGTGYVLHELTLEQAWQSGTGTRSTASSSASTTEEVVEHWVRNFVRRRYALPSPLSAQKNRNAGTTKKVVAMASAAEGVIQAWQIMGKSGGALGCILASDEGKYWGPTKSLMELRPSLAPPRGFFGADRFQPTRPCYADDDDGHIPHVAANAAVAVLKFAEALARLRGRAAVGALLQHDLVDLTRQAMSDLFRLRAHKFFAAVTRASSFGVNVLERKGVELLALINETDALLATDRHFLFGRWVNASRRWGGGDAEDERLLIYNAINQVTLWGPRGEISDYASKQWAGLMRGYYYPRWELFIRRVVSAVRRRHAPDEHAIAREIFRSVELPFQDSAAVVLLETSPHGDALLQARALLQGHFSLVNG